MDIIGIHRLPKCERYVGSINSYGGNIEQVRAWLGQFQNGHWMNTLCEGPFWIAIAIDIQADAWILKDVKC